MTVALRPAACEDLPWLQALARDPAVAPFLATIAADQLAAALGDAAQELLVIEHAGRRAGARGWSAATRATGSPRSPR